MIQKFAFESHTFSVFQKSKNDHGVCGDSYWLKETEEDMIGVIADGLGSGEEAQSASQAAISTVEKYQDRPLQEIVSLVNDEQTGYRGVVLSIIKYDKKTKILQFCGVGNIKLKLITSLSEVKQPRPNNGFLSGRPVNIKVHEMVVEPESWLTMYSDGIDFRVKDLFSLYQVFASCSNEEINRYFKTADVREYLNNDDLTILIGKPN